MAAADFPALIARHRDLLEAETRAPFGDDGIWLARPDGYVAMTATRGDWDKVGAYLDWVAGVAKVSARPRPCCGGRRRASRRIFASGLAEASEPAEIPRPNGRLT